MHKIKEIHEFHGPQGLIKDLEALPKITSVHKIKEIHEFHTQLSKTVRTLKKLEGAQSYVYSVMDKLGPLFLENEAQIDRNNYGTVLFMSKQVSLDPAKNENQPKIRYRPFLHEALQLHLLCLQGWRKVLLGSLPCNYPVP